MILFVRLSFAFFKYTPPHVIRRLFFDTTPAFLYFCSKLRFFVFLPTYNNFCMIVPGHLFCIYPALLMRMVLIRYRRTCRRSVYVLGDAVQRDKICGILYQNDHSDISILCVIPQSNPIPRQSFLLMFCTIL